LLPGSAAVALAIQQARGPQSNPLGNGRHVIKTARPLIADLMSRDLFLELHERCGADSRFEIAFPGNFRGRGAGLSEGKFGMARRRIILEPDRQHRNFFWNWLWGGCGKISGVTQARAKNAEPAFCTMLPHRIPVTIHSQLHGHSTHAPAADGAALGASTTTISIVLRVVKEMHPGVYLNWGFRGAAPEIFLRRFRGAKSRCAVAAHHHRKLRFYPALSPMQNVVKRPTAPLAKAVPRIRKATPSPDTQLLLPWSPRVVSGWRKPHPKGSQDCGQKRERVQIL